MMPKEYTKTPDRQWFYEKSMHCPITRHFIELYDRGLVSWPKAMALMCKFLLELNEQKTQDISKLMEIRPFDIQKSVKSIDDIGEDEK